MGVLRQRQPLPCHSARATDEQQGEQAMYPWHRAWHILQCQHKHQGRQQHGVQGHRLGDGHNGLQTHIAHDGAVEAKAQKDGQGQHRCSQHEWGQ